MKQLCLLFSSLLLLSWPTSHVHSQTRPVRTASSSKVAATAARAETLTNKSIIALSAAGLTPDIIMAKIASSSCSFDLSTNSLVALKQAGVTNEIMKAMMEKASDNATPIAKRSGTKAFANASKLDMVNHPYARNRTTGVWSPVEKTTASIKSKMVGLGYGGTKFLYQIPEEKSPIRLAAADSVSFLINTSGAAPELILYQTKPEKGKRAAVGAQFKMTGVESGQDVLPFNVVSVGDGIFRLVPTKKLPPGEYFFTSKVVGNGTTSDAYAFGLD